MRQYKFTYLYIYIFIITIYVLIWHPLVVLDAANPVVLQVLVPKMLTIRILLVSGREILLSLDIS